MLNIHNSSTLYVDQKSGSKKYSGLTAEADGYGNGPYPSIDYALKVVKNLRATGDRRPITICLTEDYYLQAPVEIKKQMGALTVESFGKRRRIVGGFALEGWKKDEFRGVACLSAQIPEDKRGVTFSDLFVNQKRAPMTRYPKTGTLCAVQTENDKTQKEVGLFCSSRWFQGRAEDLEGLEGIENAFVNYYHYWIDEHSPVASYDRKSHTVTMAYASRFTLTAQYDRRLPSDMHYYFTNLPASFSRAGEWYWDRDCHKVYYCPRDGETAEALEVFVPLTDRLFVIESEDVRLRNLELTVTKCDYESRACGQDELTGLPLMGETPYGSDVQSVCYAPGAITIRNSARVGISHCYLHSVGVHGIGVEEGCHHVSIENNRLEDLAAGGIKIFGGQYGSPEAYHTHDCLISSNEICRMGMRYEAGCGIFLCNTHDNRIENNHVHHGGYTGISVGWVWGYDDNMAYGNLITGNHIHHLGNGALSDMGGIYTLGKQPGTVVSHNHIHHVACENYGAWGIYLDEGSSYITVEHNLVHDTGTECFFLHYGSHNVIKRNIFAGTSGYSPVGTVKNELLSDVLFEQNVLLACGAPIYHHTTGANTIASRSNLLWDTERGEPCLYRCENGEELSLSAWQSIFGQDACSIVADPKFVSVSQRDFRFSEDSPAAHLGFCV